MQAAAVFLVRTLLDLYLLVYLLRFLMQWTRSDFYNPIAQFVVRVTNPLVVPLRRVLPGFGGLDLASLVVLIVLEFIATGVLIWLVSGLVPDLLVVLKFTPLRLVSLVLWFYFASILIYVILSWVGQRGPNPLTSVLASLNEPVLGPFRRLIPPIGGLDLSPMIVLLLIQALRIALPLPQVLA